MRDTQIYNVAGHRFSVSADDALLEKLSQYAPFEEAAAGTAAEGLVFTLQVMEGDAFPAVELTEDFNQDDDGSQIVAGRAADGRSYFEFLLFGRRSGRMLASDNREAELWLDANWLFGLNNALMVMYTLSTACLHTALFHSSVISYEGRGYMFLGKSGTGKSTHSSLWLKHIGGTELMNDDNPVVRVFDDGRVIVYGSPWSGKTPCYRNVSLPLGGLVLLSQALYNKIKRVRGIQAYAALVPSISGKRWDARQAEGLHETEDLLAQLVGVWQLECLPDEAAAHLCCEAITHE